MKTRIRQASLAAGLLVPLALSALTSPPLVARAPAPSANRFLGPLFPPLVDDGDGIPEEGVGGDTKIPVTFPASDRIGVDCGFGFDPPAPDITVAASNLDGAGRFQTLTILGFLFVNHTISAMNPAATMFSYSNAGGSSSGTGELLDANGDGVFDQFKGTGARSSGPVSFTVSLVTFDVTGDGNGDYVALAGGLAALPTFMTEGGTGFCQTTAAQVFIPLADCSGDGAPDCIALGDSGGPLPQYLEGPTLAGPTLDLAITKTDSPDPVGVGQTLTFSLAVSNAGSAAAGNVTVTDTLPAGVTFLSASGSGWICGHAGGVVTCTRPSLPVGAAPSITIAVTAPASPGTLSNTATVTSNVPDKAAGNDSSATTTTVAAAVDLSITKTDAPDPVAVGQPLTYTVAVANAGPSVAQNVRVSDTLPAGVTFVNASGTGWSCGQVGGVVTCTRPSLPVGAAPSITIAVTAPLTNGTSSNTATVTSDALELAPGNNSSTTSTTVITALTLTINGLTSGASITHTSPFLDLSGTASVLPATGPQALPAPRASIASVTWANNRGGSGTADGTTSWRAQFIPLQPGANGITILATDSTGNTALATLTVTVNELLYYLAEGATGPFFDLDLLLGNPNAVAAPVQITYLKEDGSTIVQQETLAPTSERTIRVNAVPGLATGAVSTVVASTSGVPLIVERTMLWDAAAALGGAYYGGHTAEAVSSPRTQWLFAEGSQGFFDTYLLLANANATPANATITYLLEGAAPVVRHVTVGATSRVTLFAGLIPELVGKSFGIQVSATQPIIAERAMYFSTGRFWEGGHESAGVTEAATRWFLAEGATGGFFDTYVLVSNANSGPATLTVTYLLNTGESIVKTHTVPGNARITINLENEDARLASAAVSTTVVASVPVVVERAMYWAGAFTNWYEAHNAFGVTAAGTRWGLAEGRVGTALGYETYILLANPSASPANVQITYLRGNGTTVVKNYVVGPTSRFNVTVNVDVPELANESFGAVVQVTNGVAIAVERALYWSAPGRFWTGGTNASATRLP